jgi:hypothetical protein
MPPCGALPSGRVPFFEPEALSRGTYASAFTNAVRYGMYLQTAA